MKYFSSCVFLLITFSTWAQTGDTTQSSVQRAYGQQMIQVPLFQGQGQEEAITPTGQKLCFDKIIKVKQQTSRGPAETCLFINTKIGLIAHSPIKRGSVGDCDIKPELSEFNLFVVGLKGNTYHYFNTKKQGTVEHWVLTANSQTALYQFSSSPVRVPLVRKNEARFYCDGKAKAFLYRVDGKPEEWYLFGKNYPDEIYFTDKKFMGNYGIGYQFTDKGTFIIMQLVSGAYDTKIEEISDMEICFNPAAFKIYEDEHFGKAQESINRERETLLREEVKVAGKPCEAQEMIRINYQKNSLLRKEENLQLSRQQNMYQSSIRIQKARADALIDYNDIIQISIYETQTKICKTELQLSRAQSSSRQRYDEKLKCLNRQLQTQMQVQRQMEHLDIQYRNAPGRAFQEKAKISMRALTGCN